MPRPDFVVAGGGIAGLATARALAKSGATCVLVERFNTGRAASWAAGGILSPQAEAAPDSPLMPLALAARKRHAFLAEELAGETGIVVEYHRFGVLRLAFDEAEAAELRALVDAQRAAGLKAEIVSAEGLRQLEPAANPEAISGALFPDDHRVDNRGLLKALHEAAIASGVEMREDQAALGLEIVKDRVVAVRTTGSRIETGGVVNALGAWAASLPYDPAPPPIRPVKGHMLALEGGLPAMRHVVYGGHGYVIPRGDGALIAGSTMEEAGYDLAVNEKRVATVRETAARIVPETRSAQVADSWTGLRPASPDGLPILGRSPKVENLFLAAGLFRNGILLGPLVGDLVAGIARGASTRIDLAPFSPGRFSKKA